MHLLASIPLWIFSLVFVGFGYWALCWDLPMDGELYKKYSKIYSSTGAYKKSWKRWTWVVISHLILLFLAWVVWGIWYLDTHKLN